ncbi:MAG: glutathione synthase [Deltaproteobacteria bacterium RIFCSPHIGHO2_12_FULL_43_9]|nr:MAG: glutathione synthase [Deltaproteobacteria bacterium RIFCSPHIGHO2_12_FULL_43_9]
MKFVFVMNRLETVDPDSDTGILFIEESLRRGHETFWLSHDELSLRGNIPFGLVRQIHIDKKNKEWWRFGECELVKLDSFNAIFMRHDPPFDEKYLTATYILDFLSEKTFIMNRPKGIRAANEKIYALNFPQFSPATIITSSEKEILSFVDEHKGKAIIKPIYLMRGLGIHLLRDDDPNLSSIIETVTDYGKQHVIVQEYLKEGAQGDKRILLLNGRPIGTMTRIPRPGQIRANLRYGSTCVKTTLTDKDMSICDAIAPSLIRDGLYFVGLDVIGGYLTEVNVTSPTGTVLINRLQNVQLEKMVIDFVESKAS